MTTAWADLGPRVASAVVLLVVGCLAAWAGPFTFGLLVAAVSGLMTWELVRMHLAKARMRPLALGVIAGLLIAGFDMFWKPSQLPTVLAACALLSLAYVAILRRDGWLCALYGFCIGATGLIIIDMAFSRPVLLFLLLGVVIASDVGGYFAGKAIGGRKFWPSISPKKTWAGIVGGWILAACFAALMDVWVDLPNWIAGWAVVIAFASQIGDIAESAVKRRAGVKDSSNLIPGHGGFLDRFDGVVGAALALAAMALLT